MLDFLTLSTRATSDSIALIYGGEKWTYAGLNEQCNRLSAGLQPNIHIGVLMSNRPEYVILIHALVRLNAVLIPLNTRLTPAELGYQVQKSRCALVVYDDTTAIKADTLACPKIHINDLSGESLHLERELDLTAPHAIVFTSGTTGSPKGAVLTYSNHFYSATASAFRLGIMPGDRWLLCLPLFHVGGLAVVMRSALYVTTIVLHDGFDVDAVNHAIDTQNITIVSLVPTMLYRLLEARNDRPFPPSLRLVLLGGAAASPQLIERCHRLNVPIAPTYGLTEANSQVATITPPEARRKPGTVGKPLPFTKIRIVDENGNTLPAGEYGEIVVSGPTIMAGYYDEPQAIRNGELYTGDIGYLDKDGDLWLIQRRSDLIVSGGENVYPVEVETVLRQHPAVEDVCVVGIPSVEWGQQVAAAVILRHDTTLEDLLTFARQSLAGYKLPRKIRFVGSFPQTSSGKIQRVAVTELFKD
jgi:o-succinylbenzoate---CoA ligase